MATLLHIFYYASIAYLNNSRPVRTEEGIVRVNSIPEHRQAVRRNDGTWDNKMKNVFVYVVFAQQIQRAILRMYWIIRFVIKIQKQSSNLQELNLSWAHSQL